MLYLLEVITLLKINHDKCELIDINIHEEVKARVQRTFGMPWSSLSVKYLGLLLSDGAFRARDWQPFI